MIHAGECVEATWSWGRGRRRDHGPGGRSQKREEDLKQLRRKWLHDEAEKKRKRKR
jgi:hypothetical protein